MAIPTLGAMIAAMGSPAEWGAISTSLLYWDNATGRLGIGTASLTVKLHVAGNVILGISGGTNNSFIQILDGSIITKLQSQTVGDTTGIVGTESNNLFKVITNNVVRMTFDTAGNVGIGTTAPAAMLSIGVDGANDTANYGRGLQITRAASNTGQHISMIRAGNAVWSLGYLYGTNTFAIGQGQITDSSFNAANSVLSCNATGAVRLQYGAEILGNINFSEAGTTDQCIQGNKTTGTMILAGKTNSSDGPYIILGGPTHSSFPGQILLGSYGTSGSIRFFNYTSGWTDLGGIDNVGNLTAPGYMTSNATRCRPGTGGTLGSNYYNLYWTTSACQLWIDTSNIGNITVSSDARLKENIKPVDKTSHGLDAILRLKPVEFFWKNKTTGERKEFGFLAQDVATVMPELVRNIGMTNEDISDGMLAIDHIGLIAPIVQAIQELSEKLKKLDTKSFADPDTWK